tara:strand:+ start:224 stop:394 length:171 start_codon:yes stop_codon:yes gene_type:complete
MIIFKITKEHIDSYPELNYYDLGMYGLKISDDKEVMVYENKNVATKALAYFRNMFK